MIYNNMEGFLQIAAQPQAARGGCVSQLGKAAKRRAVPDHRTSWIACCSGLPDPRKLFLITVVAGLGLAVGGSIFMPEMSDTSLRKRDDLEDKFGLAILANQSRASLTKWMSSRHRIRTVATAVSVVFALLLTAGFASLNFQGAEKTLKLIGLHG
ncbi:MAG: hypothetical protein MZV70_46030 [Desulfobacterales bacterium]|nr:hypothetical protein [Desulfobacterales bacterium]